MCIPKKGYLTSNNTECRPLCSQKLLERLAEMFADQETTEIVATSMEVYKLRSVRGDLY
jgi:predicted house-cleaning noncanonical NTP pyrophosphatase (MazG superfamily)